MGWKKNKKEEESENQKEFKNIIDKPTEVDYLDYQKYAKIIAKKIRGFNLEDTPVTFGIFGEWGSGKTSFLNFLEQELNDSNYLEEENKEIIIPIRFNAWKYENEENLWAALLQLVLNNSYKGKPLYKKIKQYFQLLWKKIDWQYGILVFIKYFINMIIQFIGILFIYKIILLIINYDFTNFQILNLINNFVSIENIFTNFFDFIIPFIILCIKNLDVILKIFDFSIEVDFSKFKKNENYKNHIAFLDKFTNEFNEIIKIISKKTPIVIYIDDLDRCFPEKTIKILESIKNFLDIKNIIFIIAVDPVVIEQAIYHKYKKEIDIDKEFLRLDSFYGKDYFEKIIQIPFSLPSLSEENIDNLLRKLYNNEVNKYSELIRTSFPKNPRKIKRLIQIFSLHKGIILEDNQELSELLILKLLIIQDQYKDLYKKIIMDVDLLLEIQKYYIENMNKKSTKESNPIDEVFNGKGNEIMYFNNKYPLKNLFLYEVENYPFTNKNILTHLFQVKELTEYGKINEEIIDDKLRKDNILFIEDFFQYFNYENAKNRNKVTEYQILEFYENNRFDSNKKNKITLTDLLNNHKNILLEADFGSGKTAFLNFLFDEYKKNLITGNNINNKSDLLIPIKINLSEVWRNKDSIRNYHFDAFLFKLVNICNPFIDNLKIKKIIQSGKCVFMFDGIEKLYTNNLREAFSSVLYYIQNSNMNNRIIITSRGSSNNTQIFKNRNFSKIFFSDWNDEILTNLVNKNDYEYILNSLRYFKENDIYSSEFFIIEFLKENYGLAEEKLINTYLKYEYNYLLNEIYDNKNKNIQNLSKSELIVFIDQIANLIEDTLYKKVFDNDIWEMVEEKGISINQVNDILDFLINGISILTKDAESGEISFRNKGLAKYIKDNNDTMS